MKQLDEFINDYALIPHPEGGHYRETYRSTNSTGIFYLLRKGERSALHRIKSDEMWHFYGGDSLLVVEVLASGEIKETLIHSKNAQYVVSANTWFGAYLPEGSNFAFCGCTVAPAFHFSDFELATNNSVHLPDNYKFLLKA
jgi:predicted cupin superfamily sugar epimerase